MVITYSDAVNAGVLLQCCCLFLPVLGGDAWTLTAEAICIALSYMRACTLNI